MALYDDYIVFSVCGYIGVWKSSFDNLEHQQLQFDLQHCIKVEDFIEGICIHNGIIYTAGSFTVRTWNIETGEIIQEFRYNQVGCMTVNDQYLFVSDYNKIIALDLQTNKTDILSDEGSGEGPVELLTINNKIISVNNYCNIKIWNLDDQQLFKEFKYPEHRHLRPASTICADTKRLAALTMDGDVVIYDFTGKLRKKYLKHL